MKGSLQPLHISTTKKQAKKRLRLTDEASQSLRKISQSQLKDIESNSFFDTKFDNLYNKLQNNKKLS